jgi:TPP-dependent pyruvate/acetoin dehydrogenase alpha subunit
MRIPPVVEDEDGSRHASEVFERVRSALSRARSGEGPTLIEVRISTDPDPLEKLRGALLAEGALTESDDFAFRREVLAELERATVEAFDKALPVDSLFENVFSGGSDGRLSPLLESQRAALRAAHEGHSR